MTRSEHLQWCKNRALEYCESGDLHNAIISMVSDLGKHVETEQHAGIQLSIMMMAAGKLANQDEVRKFINGFQ